MSGEDPRGLIDALRRRSRFAPPQPLRGRIEISDSDLAVFEALHRHGPLPTHYLFRFSGRQSFNTFQHRLTKLYNGAGTASYLFRPSQQFASFHARYQHMVYDLSDAAKALLRERGKLSPLVSRTDPFLHRLMSACVGASIELACGNVRYIPRAEVLARKGNRMELPLSSRATKDRLVPDDVFGLKWENSVRFFAVEIDRNTESIARRKRGNTTFGEKLLCYLDAMRNHAYHEQWGIRNLSVLTITTHDGHARNLESCVQTLDPSLSDRFYFKTVPEFGPNWRVPAILTNLLEGLTAPVRRS